jgi:hypothetical protein
MSINDLIPAEILSDIFQKSLPRCFDGEGRLAFQTIRSACPKWRAVSLSSPILWSSLSLSCHLDNQDQYHVEIRRMDGWFSQAGPVLPLELHLMDLSTIEADHKARVLLEAFVRRHEHRWRVLSLCLDPSSLWDVVFRPPSMSWSSLHTFKLWAYDFMNVGDESARHGFMELRKMPALRCIIIQGVHEYSFQEQYGPAMLEELHLDKVGVEEARLISSYQHLTTLVLTLLCELSLSPNDRFHWPTITSFTFDAFNIDLLVHLTIPNLVKLDIKLQYDPDNIGCQSEILSGFLARSGTSALKSVTVDSVSAGAFVTKVIPTLANLPHLTHLDLDVWPSFREMALCGGTSEKDWFPTLQVMSISMKPEGVVEVERMQSLAAFLRRREAFRLPQLETLTVHRCRGATDFPYELFKEVRVGRLSVMVPW